MNTYTFDPPLTATAHGFVWTLHRLEEFPDMREVRPVVTAALCWTNWQRLRAGDKYAVAFTSPVVTYPVTACIDSFTVDDDGYAAVTVRAVLDEPVEKWQSGIQK